MKTEVKWDPVGQDGNAFFLMGSWSHAARAAGWTKDEIDATLAEAMSGDYDNLLRVLISTTLTPW